MSNSFPELKNDLLLKALQGEIVNRPPVWMMRQAGRFLPEYRELQEKYSFFERCETPELASQITIMPIDILQTDAAILFSDILVIAQALDFKVTIDAGIGPVIHNPVGSAEDIDKIVVPDIHDRLHYVMEAVTLTRNELNGRVPLIGFAGAPWTIFCYLVEGKGSKDFSKAKQFYFKERKAAQQLLEKITEATILYLNAQIDAGAQALQVFDSWAGMLGPDDFMEMAFPYLEKITDNVDRVPVILFAKGSWYALDHLSKTKAKCLGLDWTISPEYARLIVDDRVTLQGNFDPSHLLAPVDEIKKSVINMINRFGKQRYIVNLGHGILPNVPVDHAKAFVDTVRDYH